MGNQPGTGARTILWPNNHSHNGGDVDNPPSIPRGMRLLSQHLRESILASQENRLCVDAHGRIPGFFVGEMQHGWFAGLEAYAGIVDKAS